MRLRSALVALGLLASIAPVVASNAAVGLGDASARAVTIPTWLYLLSGGAVVGVSALLAGVVTDRRLLAHVQGWGPHREVPAVLWRLRPLGPTVGLLLVAVVIHQGWTGPQLALVNPSVRCSGWSPSHWGTSSTCSRTWSTDRPVQTRWEQPPDRCSGPTPHPG